MRGLILTEPYKVEVQNVPDAKIEKPTDVLLRVTSAGVCGTDLHFYEGRMPANGMLIGHEALGVVEEVGPAVISVKKGDRVVVPTHICCGFCPCCVEGRTASCLTTNPGNSGAAYGYPNMGDYRGTNAELLRVPLADANCLKLPGEAGDEHELDFVLLADALPTGYHAAAIADVGPGDSVAIFGAGSIGLLAALSARIRGAAEIYVVDYHRDRLDKAAELGATPVNFTEGNPVEQIRTLRKRHRKGSAYQAEEQLGGVTCGIDAIGFQARSRENPDTEDPEWVIGALADLVNPAGRISIVGVFPPKDPDGPNEHEKKGELVAPWGKLFKKSIRVAFGRDDDERWNRMLREMIVAGKIRPSQIVTKHLPMSEAPDAFARFNRREEGYIKIVLDPAK